MITSLLDYDEDERSYDICVECVENNGMELKYVNPAMITEELCDIAIDNDPESYIYVPSRLQNEEMVLKVMTAKAELFKDIDYMDRSIEVYLLAVKNN